MGVNEQQNKTLLSITGTLDFCLIFINVKQQNVTDNPGVCLNVTSPCHLEQIRPTDFLFPR